MKTSKLLICMMILATFVVNICTSCSTHSEVDYSCSLDVTISDEITDSMINTALPTEDDGGSVERETASPETPDLVIQPLPTRPPGEWGDVALLPPARTERYRTELDLTALFSDATYPYFKVVCAYREDNDPNHWNLIVLSDCIDNGLVFPDNAGNETRMMISLIDATGTELRELTSSGKTTITVTASRQFYSEESPYLYNALNTCRLESTKFRDNAESENCSAGMIIYFDGCVSAFCDESATDEVETIKSSFDFWQSRYFNTDKEDSHN